MSKSYSKHTVVDDVYWGGTNKLGPGSLSGTCKKGNCGLVSMKGEFLVTFILSTLSAAFGVGKFVKNGPMTLVPRERYGPSFVLGTFFVALNLFYKVLMLAVSLYDHQYPVNAIFIWSSTFLLPQFVYVCLTRFFLLYLSFF